jgi:hypothetical protein
MAKPNAQDKAPPTVTKPAATKKAAGSSVPAKRRTDWEAVERDYRTGKFTLRELEEKHGAFNSSIARKAKKDGWTQDLSRAIQQATNAKLAEALVSDIASEGAQNASATVLAAAEVNKQVILGHRKDVTATRNVAAALLEELSRAALLAEEQELLTQVLAGSGAEPADEARIRATVQKALSLPSRVGSVKQLADTFDKLQLAERRAFGLDDKTDRPESSLAEMATDELKRMREELRNGG